MQIDIRFNIGDEVYVCKTKVKKERELCRICDGTGVITIKGKIFECPECYGKRTVHTKSVKSFVPEKRTITRGTVSITENNGKQQILRKYDCKAQTHREETSSIAEYRNIIFTTLEEAETRCKKLMEEEK